MNTMVYTLNAVTTLVNGAAKDFTPANIVT